MSQKQSTKSALNDRWESYETYDSKPKIFYRESTGNWFKGSGNFYFAVYEELGISQQQLTITNSEYSGPLNSSQVIQFCKKNDMQNFGIIDKALVNKNTQLTIRDFLKEVFERKGNLTDTVIASHLRNATIPANEKKPPTVPQYLKDFHNEANILKDIGTNPTAILRYMFKDVPKEELGEDYKQFVLEAIKVDANVIAYVNYGKLDARQALDVTLVALKKDPYVIDLVDKDVYQSLPAEYRPTDSKQTLRKLTYQFEQDKPQRRPENGIILKPLPPLAQDNSNQDNEVLRIKTYVFEFYGKLNHLRQPYIGTLVNNYFTRMFCEEWGDTLAKGTITFRNKLKLQVDVRNSKIVGFGKVLAWGTSRMDMFELEPFITDTLLIPRHIYHALDVVDSGWGDSFQYNLDYLSKYKGQVQIITMCHGCISPPFRLKNNQLIRQNMTPNGVCSYNSFSSKIDLYSVFDTPEMFAEKTASFNAEQCSDEDLTAAYKDDLNFANYKRACTGKTTTFNKEFKKGQNVMNRTYSGPGFAPIYMGYISADTGWKYVNAFAHFSDVTTLQSILDLCLNCSVCTVTDRSCAPPCSGTRISQADIESTGGTRRLRKQRKRTKSKK
jgi:hypothetical protein